MATFPVLDIDARRFPMPTLEQGSPFGGALSNAIAKRLAMAKAQEAEAELPYAGLAKLADIRSKNAYSSVVQPQYQAKIFETILANPELRASLKDPQSMLNLLTNLGLTAGGNNNNDLNKLINEKLMQVQQGQNTSSGFGASGILGGLGSLGNMIKNYITGEQPEAEAQSSILSNQQTPQVPQIQQPASVVEGTSGRTPESVAFEERGASTKKQLKKGETLGAEEAKQQAEYGPVAQGVIAQQRTLDSLNNIYKEPEIKNIADVPFATGKSIAWYKQSGTPQEKDAIGRMETAENEVIASSFGIFGSRVTNNDLKFLQRMKPAETDPLAVRQGKINEIIKYTQARAKQIQLADKYMSQGMSQTQAEFKAAEEIKSNESRNKSSKENKSTNISSDDITVENLQHTAKELGISVPEVIKRLNKKGIKIPEGAIRAY